MATQREIEERIAKKQAEIKALQREKRNLLRANQKQLESSFANGVKEIILGNALIKSEDEVEELLNDIRLKLYLADCVLNKSGRNFKTMEQIDATTTHWFIKKPAQQSSNDNGQ